MQIDIFSALILVALAISHYHNTFLYYQFPMKKMLDIVEIIVCV